MEPSQRRGPAAREVSLGAPPQRMLLLAGLGTLLGCVGGLAAFAVVRLVALISNLALLHRIGTDLPDLQHYHPSPVLIPTALGGALVVAVLALWAPVIKGHGIPESLEAVVLRESRIQPRVLLAKPASAALAMGTGGPFGAEGPIIVTGGCIGSLVGQRLRVSAAERRILLATGAAAGMAGVFSTPIAAVVLAFELLLFERSLRALLPLLLATGVATEIHSLLLGSRPLFAANRLLEATPLQLPLFLVLGVAAGLLAIVLNKGLFWFEAIFGRLPLPEFWHPLVGGLGFACIGLAVPGSLSVGYWAITDAVNDRFVFGAAAVLFAAKLFSWWVSLASGTSGGTLAPIFLIGATMGEAIGIGFAHLFPSAQVEPSAFALVAMGATFGAASRALLTGGIFALEVTGSYHLVVPMVVALAVAELVAERGLSDRLMTDKLVRRGLRVEFDAEVDPFRTVTAGQAMDPLPPAYRVGTRPTVDRLAYLRDALVPLLSADEGEVVVTENGAAVGLLRRNTVSTVLNRRLQESEPQLPVLHWPHLDGAVLRARRTGASLLGVSRVHPSKWVRRTGARRDECGPGRIGDMSGIGGMGENPDLADSTAKVQMAAPPEPVDPGQ
jgi:CIC family chloride channel protein